MANKGRPVQSTADLSSNEAIRAAFAADPAYSSAAARATAAQTPEASTAVVGFFALGVLVLMAITWGKKR